MRSHNFRHSTAVLTALMLLAATAFSGDDLDRTKRPVAPAATPVSLPAIQKATLANGLQVMLVEHHELPTVAFSLVIQAGSDHDAVTQPGLASMTADLLDEGTTTRDALQISDAIEALGASFSINAGVDGSFMNLSTLTKHMGKALDVFADVLLNPAFPEAEFDRIAKTRLASLVQQRDQPVAIANNVYSYLLYGPNHPYGNNPSGTEASLAAMKAADLQKFYATYYRPNNATLLIVGDVTLDAMVPMLDRLLAGWKPAEVPTVALPEARPADQMKVYLVDKPGAPQSQVRIGYPALARSTPDFFPVLEMNRLLGGQFTSRINLNLREKHGYTYGARSEFQFRKAAGPFTASGGIVTEKTDSACREFLNEVTAMRDRGMTAEELAFVKKGLVGNFALTFETPAQIANNLTNVVLYRLPEDYYNTYVQNIESVSLDDVQRVARTYLDPAKMAMVVVGDLSKIQTGMTAMNFGEVVLCDVNGNPLPFIHEPNK